MISHLSVLSLILLTAATTQAESFARVTGRIVDADGKPAAGARIAEHWYAEDRESLKPVRPAVSSNDGNFLLELELYGRDTAVMAVDATGTRGGVATVHAKTPEEPIEIRLSPLVEASFRYTSESENRKLGRMYVTWLLAGDELRIAVGMSSDQKFTFKLPPGRYTLRGEESRHDNDEREILLAPGMPVELEPITLRLSPLTRLYGKAAPAWHVTHARGVPADVQPADFRGKWVVLEFWGYWCGACVQRGLPGWIAFADDHSVDSDKFVVLAVHDPQATDFPMLENKLKPIIHRAWHGKPLPFPVLLDTSGRMVKDYGIESWPTAVLIDPEGRVVDFPSNASMLRSSACEDFLASKLTPLSAEKRIARALDTPLSLAVNDDHSLVKLLKFYSEAGGISIRPDLEKLTAAGLAPTTRIFLKTGGTLSLRAWLNLTLEPLNLTYVAEANGLRVVPRTVGNSQLAQASLRQTAENVLVAESLQRHVTFEFDGDSLKQVIATLESKTGETFLIDPECRKAGTIDPESALTGAAVSEPLSSALTRLLAPLGITFAVRNEAVVFTRAR